MSSEGNEMGFECPKCENKEPKHYTKKIRKSPWVLFIKLNRPIKQENLSDLSFSEKRKLVAVPEKLLLGPFTDDQSRLQYQLQGVVSHCGSGKSGHYIALCRQQYDSWQCFNDSTVSDETLSAFLGRQYDKCDGMTPFILAYRKTHPVKCALEESSEDGGEKGKPLRESQRQEKKGKNPSQEPQSDRRSESSKARHLENKDPSLQDTDRSGSPAGDHGLIDNIRLTRGTGILARHATVFAGPLLVHAETAEGTTYSRKVSIVGDFRVQNTLYPAEMEGQLHYVEKR